MGRGTVSSVSESKTASKRPATLGKISLQPKRVSEQEYEAHQVEALRRKDPKEVRRLNLLVPYLDLFHRLNDEELARLAGVPTPTVRSMRAQVNSVGHRLKDYVALLDRLDDQQLARVADTSPKMFQYLRLCQPRYEGGTIRSGSSRVASSQFVSLSSEDNAASVAEVMSARRGAPDTAASDAPAQDSAPAPECDDEPAAAPAGSGAGDEVFEFDFSDDDDDL